MLFVGALRKGSLAVLQYHSIKILSERNQKVNAVLIILRRLPSNHLPMLLIVLYMYESVCLIQGATHSSKLDCRRSSWLSNRVGRDLLLKQLLHAKIAFPTSIHLVETDNAIPRTVCQALVLVTGRLAANQMHTDQARKADIPALNLTSTSAPPLSYSTMYSFQDSCRNFFHVYIVPEGVRYFGN